MDTPDFFRCRIDAMIYSYGRLPVGKDFFGAGSRDTRLQLYTRPLVQDIQVLLAPIKFARLLLILRADC